MTLTAPLRLVPDLEQQVGDDRFRVVDIGRELEIQVCLETGWRSMYRFDLQPQLPIDFEALNYYVATHPESHFLTTLMAARPTESGRYSLSDNELSLYRAGRMVERRSLSTADELKAALVEVFGISLPDSRALDEALGRISAAEA